MLKWHILWWYILIPFNALGILPWVQKEQGEKTLVDLMTNLV
jgi:hypothetical protein